MVEPFASTKQSLAKIREDRIAPVAAEDQGADVEVLVAVTAAVVAVIGTNIDPHIDLP